MVLQTACSLVFYQLAHFNTRVSPACLSLRWWNTNSVPFLTKVRTSYRSRRWKNKECVSGWSVSVEPQKYAGSVEECSHMGTELKSLQDVLLHFYYAFSSRRREITERERREREERENLLRERQRLEMERQKLERERLERERLERERVRIEQVLWLSEPGCIGQTFHNVLAVLLKL